MNYERMLKGQIFNSTLNSGGDLVLWDNRCTMRYRKSFPYNARRVLHKTQTVGDLPSYLSSSGEKGGHPRASLS